MGGEGDARDNPPWYFNEANALLSAFFHTLADGTPTTEQLRRDCCFTCGAPAGDADEETLDQWCHAARCGLRDPVRLRDEWVFICGTVALVAPRLGEVPTGKTLEVVEHFNYRLAIAGCATVRLDIGPHQRFVRGLATDTLRANIHAAATILLSYLAGDRADVDVRTTSGKAAEALVGRYHRQWVEEQKGLAARLRAEVSDRELAARLGIPPRTIRDWLGTREEWEAGRGGGK